MEKFEQLKTKNDLLRFVSELGFDQLKKLENHLIQENYEIETDNDPTDSPLFEALDIQDDLLTEDAKKKVQVIFEAEVTARVNDEVAVYIREAKENINEYGEYVKNQLIEQYNHDFDVLEENLDTYLDYVINEWLEENTLSIEKGVKVQLAESVLSGLKRLFDDNYIDVPNDKINLVSSLENKNKKLYQNTISLHEENKNLNKEIVSLKKRLIVEELTKDLTDVQKEKLTKLTPSISAKTSKEYRNQVSLLVESVKNDHKKETKIKNPDQILNESMGKVENTKIVDPAIKKYLDAIAKM